MSARTVAGWQTTLADLSLILFMVTAAAASESRAPMSGANGKSAAAPRPPGQTSGPSPQSEALAIWDDGMGAPSLSRWIARQPRDPRQQLTLSIRYPPDAAGQAKAFERAASLARQAGEAGLKARIVIEPGAASGRATLAFDSSQGAMKR